MNAASRAQPDSRCAAIILAGGASTRMGRPKALCTWQGRPFVWHLVQLAAAHCERSVVVTGAHELSTELVAPATLVRNEDWERGRLSSLQTGLRAAPGADAYLVLTVDQPRVQPATIAALLAAARSEGAIVQPSAGERRGHPVVYPAEAVSHLLNLPPTATARDLYGVADLRRVSVEVDDPAIFENIDTPEDLRALDRG